MFNKIFKNNFAKVTNEDVVINLEKLREFEGMQTCSCHSNKNEVCVTINSARGTERRKFERFVRENWEGDVSFCDHGCVKVSK